MQGTLRVNNLKKKKKLNTINPFHATGLSKPPENMRKPEV